jgi:hypothetical protein
MKLFIILIALSFNALADYRSEVVAIEKFEKEVFLNKSNYLKPKAGQLPDLAPAFRTKLQSDEKSLKYFYVISSAYRTVRLFQTDPAFAGFIKKQFGGKEPSKQEWEKVYTVLGNNILKEPTSELKECLKDNSYSDEHFEKQIELLKKSKF